MPILFFILILKLVIYLAERRGKQFGISDGWLTDGTRGMWSVEYCRPRREKEMLIWIYNEQPVKAANMVRVSASVCDIVSRRKPS